MKKFFVMIIDDKGNEVFSREIESVKISLAENIVYNEYISLCYENRTKIGNVTIDSVMI